ncbi:hypothetical protein SLS56_006400 [Neofusicoccum ribis]|uniref:DUF6594 domain-containing protein n=1 Tax=Neofusicoccum ribis TaxID=45134 RepID=A0ABR3SQS6_9PEZI
MVAVRQVKSFGRPSKRDFVKVNEELKENSSQPRKDETWLFSSDGTYKREEWLNKLNYAQDLVVVAPVSKDPDPLATVFGDWRPNFSFLKSGFGKYWKPTISSRARDHTLVTGFDALSIAVLLVLPIALCYIILIRTDGNKAYGICIAVIFAFMLIFATCMPALGSDPTRNEILAATSGYCAVLVVFLGGLSQ